MSIKLSKKEQAESILSKYDTFLFDCDGVLWLGDHLLPKIVETLTLLRENNKKVIFVTNNSTKSRVNYVSKFEKFGLTATKDEIFSSSFASAVYIDTILKLPKDKKIWVLGQSGIEDELKEVGYTTIGGTDPELKKPLDMDDPNAMIHNLDPSVGAVIAGLDLSFNYHKLSMTLQYLMQKPEIPFIATNIDSTYPSKGFKLPGAGSIVDTVAFASGREPLCSCGKPNPGMMDAIVAKHHINKERTIMVGDRLNTDMKFGRDGGLATLLVLTGIETVENVEKLEVSERPTYIADKLGDLYELLQ